MSSTPRSLKLAVSDTIPFEHLVRFACPFERVIKFVVENHGGYSSDGSLLAGAIKTVNMENLDTLPDVDNYFCMVRCPNGCLKEYDRYKGIAELMP